jgi:ZIP family zinc transporter
MTPIIILCLFIPLIGTTLGSAMVFFLKKEINPRLQKVLLGFASGVMIAASIWSLLQPAINSFEKGDFRMWLYPAIGFIFGVGFMLLLDYLVPHMHMNNEEEGVKKNKLSKTFKMLLAVTLHNIPEGLVIGVAYGSCIYNSNNVMSALVLTIGIGLQNFPEGSAISLPLRSDGLSRFKSFLIGSLSAIVEPIFAFIGALLVLKIRIVLPFILSFTAGAMIFVSISELLLDSLLDKRKDLMVLFVMIGFSIMMILELLLG